MMKREALDAGPPRPQARGLASPADEDDEDDAAGDAGDEDDEDDEDDDAGDDDPRRLLLEEDSQAPNLVPEENPRNVLAGRIEILELLGQGGMGAVWRGYHLKLERPVAVKVLDETLQLRADGRERFVREARALALLDHPGVVRVYDCDEVEGRLFLCMELLEGETLRDVIKRERLDALDVIDIGRSVCDAIQVAHERGILHRDLSPSNIMRLRDGRRVKILDWGLCKYLDLFYIRTPPKYGAPPGSRMVTPLGARFGTPEYMAPEMILREDPGPPSFRTDVYALGVVLYELLTMRHPFAPGDRREPRPIREVMQSFEDLELEAALREAVRFDPSERTQTMVAFSQALERARASINARRTAVAEANAESLRAVESGPPGASGSATCLADGVIRVAVPSPTVASGSATGLADGADQTAVPRRAAPASRASITRTVSALVVAAGVGVLGTIAVQQFGARDADPAGGLVAQIERETARAGAAETRAERCEASLAATTSTRSEFDRPAPAEEPPRTPPPEVVKPMTEILASGAGTSERSPRARLPHVARDDTFAQVMRRLTPGIRKCVLGAGLPEAPTTVQVRHKSGAVDAVRVRGWSQDHDISTCIDAVIRKAKPPPGENPVEEVTFFAGHGPVTK